MPTESLIVSPGSRPRSVRDADGRERTVPDGWALLPPGDAGLTRRVKAAGPTWTVQRRRGRRTFSDGVWAPAEHIDAARADLEIERASPAYKRKLEAGRKRREEAQRAYVGAFRAAVVAWLDFDDRHESLAYRLAEEVVAHATPVGSGTVARTKRIPVEQRAAAAVIAWMRHRTTAYDRLHIPRIKGRRREVRRELARESRRLLDVYRKGDPPPDDCPLQRALQVPVATNTKRPAVGGAAKARATTPVAPKPRKIGPQGPVAARLRAMQRARGSGRSGDAKA